MCDADTERIVQARAASNVGMSLADFAAGGDGSGMGSGGGAAANSSSSASNAFASLGGLLGGGGSAPAVAPDVDVDAREVLQHEVATLERRLADLRNGRGFVDEAAVARAEDQLTTAQRELQALG